MKIIGLTGGIGSGKSYVAQRLRAMGYAVIDADAVSREIYTPGGECLREVTRAFGDGVLNSDGALDRGALAAIVFADPAALAKLNSIAHAYIREKMEAQIAAFTKNGEKGIILDAPQLFEAGINERCDAVIAVIAPMEQRLARIAERGGISQADARARIAAQHDDGFFRENADYVIDNADGADPVGQLSAIMREIGE